MIYKPDSRPDIQHKQQDGVKINRNGAFTARQRWERDREQWTAEQNHARNALDDAVRRFRKRRREALVILAVWGTYIAALVGVVWWWF